jgi:hypothetical protein
MANLAETCSDVQSGEEAEWLLSEDAHRRQEVERKVSFVLLVSCNNNETIATHKPKFVPCKLAHCECFRTFIRLERFHCQLSTAHAVRRGNRVMACPPWMIDESSHILFEHSYLFINRVWHIQLSHCRSGLSKQGWRIFGISFLKVDLLRNHKLCVSHTSNINELSGLKMIGYEYTQCQWWGHAVAQLVQALSYQHGMSRVRFLIRFIFQFTHSFQPHCALGRLNLYQKWIPRIFLGVKGGLPARKRNNLTAIFWPIF